eukprot:UN00930
MYDAFKHESFDSIDSYQKFNTGDYPSFLGNAAFVYLIHSVVLPMRNKMAKPKFCPKTFGNCYHTGYN